MAEALRRDLLKRVRRLVTAARGLENRAALPDVEQMKQFSTLPTVYRGRPTTRAVIALPTRGCLWFRRSGDACTHCGLIRDGLWDPELSWDFLLETLRGQLERVEAQQSPVLCLYVAGSFFDDQEIAPEVRLDILRSIASCKGVERLLVECRPELIQAESMATAQKELGDVELVVGLGFDSINRNVRALCLNKLTTNRRFEESMGVLHDVGVIPLVYAVLKPPFLDEGMAVEEAIATGHYAFDLGAKMVSIEPLAIQHGTLAQLLWEHDLHKPPWLWSQIAVLKDLHPRGEVLAGGSVVYPRSTRQPANCENCTETVLSAIQEFDLHQGVSILQGLKCDCENEWQTFMTAPVGCVEAQVERLVDTLEVQLNLIEAGT